jgi:hypothetical protein
VTDTPPRWAWVVSGVLAALAIALFVLGRGGTVMLFVAALAFGAIVVPLLSMPDRLPDDE